jgi:starch synthase
MPLKVCLVAAELTPLAKAGGLADVSAALTKYLHADGHDVRLFMPGYASIRREQLECYPVDFLQNLSLQLGAYRYDFSVSTARLPGTDVFVYLIDCPACYQRPSIYSAEPDEHRRFLLLTHAAFMCCQRMAFAPQIMHFNDWHSAAGTLLLRTSYAWDRLFQGARSVLTIHNVGYQGIIAASALPEVLPDGAAMFDQAELAAGRIGLLRTGIHYADLISTVSPTYAREIQTPEYGMGLEGELRARADALVGVLNGVDYDEWDPRRDRFLPRHYDPGRLGTKASLKLELQQRLALGAHGPLIGIVSRLVAQKGFDLLFEALPRLLQQRTFNLVVLGTGEPRYEEFFAALVREHPTRIYFHRGYSDELAHWIEAASDMFLMPSRYEPCGLNQMYSLRYGSVPIVRRTGGLSDSVVPFDPRTGTGTGVVFDEYSTEAVEAALERALDLYSQSGTWERLVRAGMAQDFSWNRQVHRYVQLYEQLLARAASGAGR